MTLTGWRGLAQVPARRFVVFFRAMNPGHPGSPTRAVLEECLRRSGALAAVSFQTNGTVVVDGSDSDEVGEVVVHTDHALSVVRRRGSSVGSPNDELEARLGVPATTRTMGTLERLVRRFG